MSERVESLGNFEMLWTCDHCDQKGLLGKSQRHCPNCGAKQNPDKRYFPEPGTEQAAQGHQFEGADVACQNCNAPMGAKAKNCANCGAPLDAARTVKEILGQLNAAPRPPGRNWTKIFLVIAAIAAVIGAIYVFFVRTKSEAMTVTGHRWDNTIEVVRYGRYAGAAWRDQMPPRAYSARCRQKERSTRQVATGKETCTTEKKDNRDGTFEQVKKCKPVYASEPVYDDWCDYAIDEWRHDSELRATGLGLTPSWPPTAIPATAAEIEGAKKLGARREKRILDFGAQHCEVPEAKWRALADGQKVKLEVRARSGAIVCDSF